jgi:hypothetical protein
MIYSLVIVEFFSIDQAGEKFRDGRIIPGLR